MVTEGAASPRFLWPVRIYYEDTDAAGIVYYANYLRFLERARTEWLRALGFEQDCLRRDQGVLFAVSRVELHYRLPARFNERLEVGVTLRRVGRVSLDLDQVVTRNPGEVICHGQVKIACIDADSLKPRTLPLPLLEKIRGGN